MGLARTWSVALLGVEGHMVEIEADVGGGLPRVHLVGLPDAALHESKDRVRAAVVNSGRTWPNERVVLALSPATLRKAGSGFDLALACGVLAAAEQAPREPLEHTVLLGELALDGRLRPVRGVLPCLLAARAAKARRVVVPEAALPEAALVEGLEVYGAESLDEVLAWLAGIVELRRPGPVAVPEEDEPLDLADVVGQEDARRALEVAAAGGHHLLLVGPPGTGKTMLAQRMVGLLPRLAHDEALALAAVRSVAGRLPVDRPLGTVPPLVAPHHSASMAALVGGGSGLARPGCRVARPPWGPVPRRGSRVRRPPARRAAHTAGGGRGPAVPGGGHGLLPGPVPARPRGQPLSVRAGPRPRLRVPVAGPAAISGAAVRSLAGPGRPPRPDVPDHRARRPAGPTESTATVRARVLAARAAAAQRWSEHGWRTNAEVPGPALRSRFALPHSAVRPLEAGLRAGTITARGADRALRVAWTLADLAGLERPDRDAVETALYFRDRRAA